MEIRMAKDPDYNRYAGIISLPGADGKMPRPFRVDEDGNVIYLDEERNAAKLGGREKPGKLARSGIMDWDELERKFDEEREAVGRIGAEKPIQLAETGNLDWNGYQTMRAQGQRDGQILKGLKDRFFPPEDPNAPLPPASRTYPVPAGYKAWPVDPQHRLVLDANGKPVRHPAYKEAFDGDIVDEKGVAWDLGKIAVGTAIPLRAGAMAAGGAAMMVGSSAGKEGYELAKERRSKKGTR
jgi:hypothetical protein